MKWNLLYLPNPSHLTICNLLHPTRFFPALACTWTCTSQHQRIHSSASDHLACVYTSIPVYSHDLGSGGPCPSHLQQPPAGLGCCAAGVPTVALWPASAPRIHPHPHRPRPSPPLPSWSAAPAVPGSASGHSGGATPSPLWSARLGRRLLLRTPGGAHPLRFCCQGSFLSPSGEMGVVEGRGKWWLEGGGCGGGQDGTAKAGRFNFVSVRKKTQRNWGNGWYNKSVSV